MLLSMLTASNFSRPFTEPNTSNILDLRGPTNKSISRNADEIPSFSVSTQSGPVSQPPLPPPRFKDAYQSIDKIVFQNPIESPPSSGDFRPLPRRLERVEMRQPDRAFRLEQQQFQNPVQDTAEPVPGSSWPNSSGPAPGQT